MSYLSYAEIRLLSRDAYCAIFKKGDVFYVMGKNGKNVKIVVGKI